MKRFFDAMAAVLAWGAAVLLFPGVPASHAAAQTWLTAQPGWHYEFPRDHGTHPGFKTEWWYFTGALESVRPAGREFGFELTFFRQGVRPPGTMPVARSKFLKDDFAFAHLALSDPGAPAALQFRFRQRVSRGAFDEAGWGDGSPGKLAWLDDWVLDALPEGAFLLRAATPEFGIRLRLTPVKPPVIQGENGVSQKAAGEGRTSHYYSVTRLRAEGEVVTKKDGVAIPVTGETWFDHEWATNQLAPNQIGWNWLSLQLEDGTELMLYVMRTKGGGIDPCSSGTFVRKDGSSEHLAMADFTLAPVGEKEVWKSPATGAAYPVRWRVRVPKFGFDLTLRTPLRNQELAIPPIAYWEGLVHAEGTRDSKAIKGHGYLELTGYAGPLVGIGGAASPAPVQ